MAGSPQLKIFNSVGEYIGCVKHYEDAACLVGSYGAGATVRYGHSKKKTLWTEGAEEFPAGEAYDRAGAVMRERGEAMWAAGRAKLADRAGDDLEHLDGMLEDRSRES